MNDKEKAERLAAKLRENLRKRKAQARQTGPQSDKAHQRSGGVDS